MSPGQKDKQTAQLSPHSSHDVSGSRSCSVCQSDMTQPVSAWQPAELAGRVQEVVSYLLRLNIEKVLTGPQISGKAYSQRLADGHEHRQGRSCLISEETSVFHTPRSSCAMHTMQKCKQGWPLPPLTLLLEQPVSVRQDRAFATFGWGFPQCEECRAGVELEQPPAVPGSGCSWGAADFCSIRGTGSSPWHSTALRMPWPAAWAPATSCAAQPRSWSVQSC